MAAATPDRLFYDLKIKTRDGAVLPAHRLVLASQTSYFEGLFRQEATQEVSLDFPLPVVAKCLDFLYTGVIAIEGGDVQDLLTFAKYIQVQEVARRCERFIVQHLDTSNCLEVLVFADQIGNSVVATTALQLLCKNVQKVLGSGEQVRRLPSHLLTEVLQSDHLLLFSQRGTVLPGQQREAAMEEHLNKFCDLAPHQGWIFQKIRWVEQVVYIAPAGPPARSKWVLERPVGQLRWLSEGDPRARPDQGKE